MKDTLNYLSIFKWLVLTTVTGHVFREVRAEYDKTVKGKGNPSAAP